MHILESGLMIMLQFLSHIVMVIPFWLTGMPLEHICDQDSKLSHFTGTNARTRQSALMDKVTGGKIFDEEYQALDKLALILWALPLACLASSLVDLVLVVAFQKWLHPWNNKILAESKENNPEKSRET